MLRAVLVLLCGVAMGLVGCASTPSAPPRGDAESAALESDPAAVRLHDLAGVLLLHYAQHGAYPSRLDALAGADAEMRTDPVSGRTWVYLPGAPVVLPPGRRLLVCQPVSVGGKRWAIVVQQESGAIATKVVRLGERQVGPVLRSGR